MRKAAFLFTAAVSFLFMFGLLFAQLGTLPAAISDLCAGLTSLLPIVGMLMIVVAAVVYATGQIMGMETRARANVWATAALGGALMALLIVAVAPPILAALFGSAITCTETTSTAMCGTHPYDPSTEECCPPASDLHVCSMSRCCVSGCQTLDPGPPPFWTC